MITKDIKIWTSFRYFSKTYANINEAYYFNGHWETFGGVNWQVNKKLSLGMLSCQLPQSDWCQG